MHVCMESKAVLYVASALKYSNKHLSQQSQRGFRVQGSKIDKRSYSVRSNEFYGLPIPSIKQSHIAPVTGKKPQLTSLN